MRNLKKNILSGLSISLVLAMAIGSFAIGETQTPVTPQAAEPSIVTAGAFTIIGEDLTLDQDYTFTGTTGTDGVLTIISNKEMTIKNTNTGSTTDRIKVELPDGVDEANIILDGVNINTNQGSSFEIQNYSTFNVNILLKDDSENSIVTSRWSCAGLQKSGGSGKLTIGADGSKGTGKLEAIGGTEGAGIGSGYSIDAVNIEITGGIIDASSESSGAGIGCGNGPASESNITISGGIITATSKTYGSGIGGGGGAKTATNNHLNGNAIVIATTGTGGNALAGFADSDLEKGIVFTRKGLDGEWASNIYGTDLNISNDVELPANLIVTNGKKLTVNSDVKVNIANGKILTVEDGAELVNDGTISEVDGDGIVTTKTNFYREGSTTVYKTGYQTYQNSAGQQKYKDLPDPDVTKLLKSSLNTDRFAYWYYLDEEEKEVAIKDGDDGSDVLLNQHDFYESREEAYSISTSKEGEGAITPNVTEAYNGDEVTFTVTPKDGYELKEDSVSVKAGDKDVEFTEEDGKYSFTMPGAAVTISAVFEQIPDPTPDPSVDPDGDGSGSGSSSKTSDPFMGGVALALLGVATTGAILTRKLR